MVFTVCHKITQKTILFVLFLGVSEEALSCRNYSFLDGGVPVFIFWREFSTFFCGSKGFQGFLCLGFSSFLLGCSRGSMVVGSNI